MLIINEDIALNIVHELAKFAAENYENPQLLVDILDIMRKVSDLMDLEKLLTEIINSEVEQILKEHCLRSFYNNQILN